MPIRLIHRIDGGSPCLARYAGDDPGRPPFVRGEGDSRLPLGVG